MTSTGGTGAEESPQPGPDKDVERLRDHGHAALSQRDFDVAEDAYTRALSLTRGTPSPVLADLYEGLAQVCAATGRSAAARDLMDAAADLRRGLEPVPDLSVEGLTRLAESLRGEPDARADLGAVLHALSRAERADAGRVHAARAHLEESVEIADAVAPDATETLGLRAELVCLCVMDGDLDTALAAYGRVSSRLHELPGATASSVLRTVAQVRLIKGDASGAAADATAAVDLAATSGAPAQEAAALGALGSILEEQRDLDAAVEHYRRAVGILRDHPDHAVPLGVYLIQLGMLEHERGLLDEALGRTREAVGVLRDHAPRSSEYGEALERFARVAQAAGEMGEAATALRTSAGLANDPGTRLRRELDLGLINKDLGRYDDARHILTSVVGEALEHGAPGVHWAAAMALAGIHRRTGDLEAAERTYRELELTDRPEAQLRVELLSNLGGLQYERGDHQGAADAYGQCLDLLGGDDAASALRPTLHNNLATALHGLGRLREADSHYAESVRGAQGASVVQVEAWVGRGRIALAEARSDDAVDMLEAAHAMAERLLAAAGGAQSRQALSARLEHVHEFLLEALSRRGSPGDPARALHVAERSRARTLHEQLFASEALPPRQRLQERELRQRLSHVSRRLLHLRTVPSTLPLQLAELARQERELSAALEELAAQPAAGSAPAVMTADEICAALTPGELLLEFHVVRDRVFLWAATATNLELHVLQPSVAALVRLVVHVVGPYHAVSPPEVDNNAAWRELRDVVLRPVAQVVRRASSLIVSPAGPLSLIAFEPLVDLETVLYTPSATVGLRPRAPRAARPRHAEFVGFGNPLVRTEAPEFSGLPPLPGAEVEVEDIAALFGADGVAVCGSDATERELRSWARRCRYLHIAAHGIVDLDNPMRSGIVLATPAGSGALAGPREDDVLHGYDMVDLDVEAELVVCAACHTGFGSERAGEGLATLGTALLLGGARRVLVALWPVGDLVSAAFMQEMYWSLRRGSTVPQAVGMARSALRADHPDPYWWAGFILFGARP